MQTDELIHNENLIVTKEAQSFLREASKWASFFAILGFIGISFMVILAFFMGIIVTGATIKEMMPTELNHIGFGMFSGGLIAVIYLIMALLYFFPVFYLFKFSQKLTLALKEQNKEVLARAFRYLQKHFRYIGILVIIALVTYIASIFLAVIGALSAYS